MTKLNAALAGTGNSSGGHLVEGPLLPLSTALRQASNPVLETGNRRLAGVVVLLSSLAFSVALMVVTGMQ